VIIVLGLNILKMISLSLKNNLNLIMFGLITGKKLKGNFWRKWFRKGYDISGYDKYIGHIHEHEVSGAKMAGTLSKTDAGYNRAKLNKHLDEIEREELNEYQEDETIKL
jgi:hypothetical protein